MNFLPVTYRDIGQNSNNNNKRKNSTTSVLPHTLVVCFICPKAFAWCQRMTPSILKSQFRWHTSPQKAMSDWRTLIYKACHSYLLGQFYTPRHIPAKLLFLKDSRYLVRFLPHYPFTHGDLTHVSIHAQMPRAPSTVLIT